MNATTAPTVTQEFAWGYREAVVDAIAKLAKRAAKLGLVFSADVSTAPTRTHSWRDELTGAEYREQFGTVGFELQRIALGGWRLIGVLSPMPTESGALVLYPSAVPGEELPEGVRTWQATCDHCRTTRARTETFLARHEDGRVVQLGRNCLRDFLGHDVAQLLAAYAFVRSLASFSEGQAWGGAASSDVVGLSSLLAITSAVVRREGWVSRKAAQAYAQATDGERHKAATADLVGRFLHERGKDGDEFRREHPVEQQDLDAAEAALAFWAANTDTSDYAQNGRMLVESGLVIRRAFGLAVSLLPVAQDMAQKQAEARRQAQDSSYVGVVGKRQELEVEVVGCKSFGSDWGARTLIRMRDRQGNLLTWWATGDYGFLPEANSGQFAMIRATIKQHEAYRGTKQTTLSRVVGK